MAFRLVYPKLRFRIDVHRSAFENLNKTLIAAKDFNHLLNVLHRREWIAEIAHANEKLLTVVLTEWLTADCHNVFRRELSEHLDENATLTFGGLAHTNVPRADELIVECLKTFIERMILTISNPLGL